MKYVTSQITVPKIVLKNWNERRTRGDLINIHKATNLSRPTISYALNKGIATPETILKISKFFGEKKTFLIKDIEEQSLRLMSIGK